MFKNKRYKFIYGFFIILIFGVFFTFLILNKSQVTQNYLAGLSMFNPILQKENKIDDTTTIYFVGDIMLTRGVEASVKKNFNGNYGALFENLKELKNADILFGNLEGAVSDKGNNVGSKYSFRMNPEILPILKEAGFDIFSFANNHIGDWNISAFKDSLARLEENQILKTGAGFDKNETINPTIIQNNGVIFGFLGFSDVGPNWMEAKENNPGILLASDPNFESIINNASRKCDILIVSFHWGEEYKTIHNKRQETLAHLAIDSGANIVIGHHPHVIQDIEIYKNSPIVYSLGNFIFDQYFSKETMRGMLFMATFEGKELKEKKTLISIQDKNYKPIGLFDKKTLKEKKGVSSSNCPKPKKEYEDMFYLNIGQDVPLIDTTYIPENLVTLEDLATLKNICLINEAKNSLEEMILKAKKEGVDIKVTSGYRGFSVQNNLLASAINSGNKNANISIAKAGYSEHQLGTAVDLSGKSVNYTSANGKFHNTPEDLWLRDNAYKFGFIQSYPSGKEEETGYMYEAWHYRYLGTETALLIKESGQTITEFLK